MFTPHKKAALLVLAACTAGGAITVEASVLAPQQWLPGECIPQFAAKMPVFGPGPAADLPRVDARTHKALTVTMKETTRQVLPVSGSYTNGFGTGAVCPTVNVQETKIWAYEISDTLTGKLLGPAYWPAVTVETRRRTPTTVTYVNALPNGPGSLQELISVDKTIHWSDPLNSPDMNPCMENSAASGCSQPYTGPVPAVPHLHGAEVPSQFDGGPNAWFTPDGKKGTGYNSLMDAGIGKAVYRYDNDQLPGTLWFHDHALGVTRTNVYSGLAAFYLLRDPGAEPSKLPSGPYEIEMAIQDRQFDSNSQLFFPDGSGDPASNLNGTPANPGIHPFWNPEFIGDTIVVNGTPWPYLDVEPRRYRFRLLNGANARFFNLHFGDMLADELQAPLPVHIIGADGAYLDKPAGPQHDFLLAPGERLDVIVDFRNYAGKTITVKNDARVPFPDGPAVPLPAGDPGLLPDDMPQPQMANIMQFRVSQTTVADKSCNPASGGCKSKKKTIRLADGAGNIAKKVKIDKVRQLVLKEHIAFDTSTNPPTETGPQEVLLNNTAWDGLQSPAIAADFADGISELPRVGATELWEIINLTADAHPIHTHLFQFQILNRQEFNSDEEEGYPRAWAAAFGTNLPTSCTSVDANNPCPGYGPPLPYSIPNADGAIGGNPAIGPYLTDNPVPPEPYESGWKDTARIMPGQVMRLLVRVAPTSSSVSSAKPGKNRFKFDPTTGPGYVWHCHIIDHEDNEMMRPFKIAK
jgi:FtsP/CotA-like multicopper oxidase with cupredoxin domain